MQNLEKFEEIEALRKAGRSAADATAEVGVSISTYYGWRKQFEGATKAAKKKKAKTKKKAKYSILAIPEKDTVVKSAGIVKNEVTAIILKGDAADLAKTLKGML